MTLKGEHRKFVTEMIKHGDATRAYLTAYSKTCKSKGSAAANANRLRKNDKIAALIREGAALSQQKAVEDAQKVASEEITTALLTSARKREVLANIVNGNHLTEEYFIKRDGTVSKYMRKPNPSEITKAIEIDNKMSGDNAPDKSIVSNVTPMTDIQVDRIINSLRKK